MKMNFDAVYQGRTPLGALPPWDIGRPQPEIVELERAGKIRGNVLDAGCGTGENALFLAHKGHRVTGVDISHTAIEKARRKALGSDLPVTFEVGDALELQGYRDQFDTVVDCGLMDVCEPARHERYTAALHRACRPGAHIYMLELSAEATEFMRLKFVELGVPEERLAGLPAIVPADVRKAFAAGWREEWVQQSVMHVRAPGRKEFMTVPALRAGFRRV